MNVQMNLQNPWLIPGNEVDVDPVSIPPQLLDDLRQTVDPDVIDLYRTRWSSIRSHHREPSNVGRTSWYNFRMPLTDRSTSVQAFIRSVHRRQAMGYKINASCGFILRNKSSNRLRYFHPSVNNFRVLPNPRTIQSMEQLEELMNGHLNVESFEGMSLLGHPTSEWVAVALTNVVLYLYYTHIPLIGGPGDSNDDNNKQVGFILNNQAVQWIPFETDNLCLFRCLALTQEPHLTMTQMTSVAKGLIRKWKEETGSTLNPDKFEGVSLDQFPSIERCYQVGLWLYTTEKRNGFVHAKLLRRPPPGDGSQVTKVMLHLTADQRHVHLIKDINKYAQAFLCSKCERPFKLDYLKRRHETRCIRSCKFQFKGGPYYIPRNVFEELDNVGIQVPEELRFHRFRATFDYEAYMKKSSGGARDPAGFMSEHVPMSCSIASNVPGHEGPVCLTSSGSPQDLVVQMISHLNSISRAAHDLYRELFEGILLTIRTNSREGMPSRVKKASRGLERWMKSLPVVGFNSAKYDLCLIHKYLIRALKGAVHVTDEEDDGENISTDQIWVIKRGNAIISLQTPLLHFLDICNYSAPGTSYSRYLNTYGQDPDLVKSFFPYEAVTSLEVLDQEGMPAYNAFFSSLKGCNTLEEDGGGLSVGLKNYNTLHLAWKQHGMKTLRDLLIFYNNMDVCPFLKALENQLLTYRSMGLDLLKDACTLPGLSLRFGMRGLGGVFYTLGDDMSDIHDLIRKNMVGGPSIVFTRLAEAGNTRIRPQKYGLKTAEVCRSVIGYDCNMLYPYSMAQKMPVGPCVIRKTPDFTPVHQMDQGPRYSLSSLEWLEFIAHQTGHYIQHAGNGQEVRLGARDLPVDGYSHETMTAYQYHGCLYHGHECMEKTPSKQRSMRSFEAQRSLTREQLREDTAINDDFLRQQCHVALVVMWECQWLELKRIDPDVMAFMENHRSRPHIKSCYSSPLGTGSTTEDVIMKAITDGSLFGMALVDLHVPESLKEKFYDMPPIFKTATVGREDIGDFMKSYCEQNNLLKTPRQMLISSYRVDCMLFITPLLRWYISHGLVITKVHLVIEWEGRQCFQDWMGEAADARRSAQRDPSKAMMGESAKLPANSAYGKMCEDKTKFRQIRYCEEAEVATAIRSPLFCDARRLSSATYSSGSELPGSSFRKPDVDIDDDEALEYLDDGDEEEEEQEGIYEVTQNYKHIRLDQPIQIPFFVYQYAKMKMLEFYYDLLDRYLVHRKWGPMYSDTDSMYLSISGTGFRDIVKPQLMEEFYRDVYTNWFPSESCKEHHSDFVQAMVSGRPWTRAPCCEGSHLYDQKTPGLFKVEWQGEGMVCLCSKTYYCSGVNKDKMSCKGIQKSRNSKTLTYARYKDILDSGKNGGGVNMGFRFDPSTQRMYTYSQTRQSLSYLYGKRKVLEDGIHTAPLDIWSTSGELITNQHIWLKDKDNSI